MSSTERVGWTSGPNTRGTLDIVWGAFVTLALCVWTAVHPNINIQLRPSIRRDLLVRLAMMVVAVIFPEILISAAWNQRIAAQRLTTPKQRSKRSKYSLWKHKEGTASLDRLTSTDINTIDDNESDAWSSEQAFFVVMGGFALDQTYTDENGLKQRLRSVLTIEGFKLMQRAGYAPKLTKADVEERSNADIIAKVVVVTQVVWFAIQVIGRLASGLTVTALEVHTIVHVGCAILMYILWWNKPYAVTRSVLLQTDEEKNIGALLLFHSVLCEMHQEAVKRHEAARKQYWENRAIASSQALLEHDPPPENPRMPTIEQALATYTSDEIDSPNPNRFETLLRSIAKNAHAGGLLLLDHTSSVPMPESIDQGVPGWRGVRETSDNFTLRQVWGSWTVDTGHEMTTAKLMHFLFNLLYGGGHIAAWNSSAFPTSTEAWIWRLSAIVVASLFAYGTIWVLFWMAVRSQSKWLLPVRRGDLNIVMGPFFASVILAYFCARCYFFVESMISLRSLPPLAYQTVQWSNFLPHSG